MCMGRVSLLSSCFQKFPLLDTLDLQDEVSTSIWISSLDLNLCTPVEHSVGVVAIHHKYHTHVVYIYVPGVYRQVMFACFEGWESDVSHALSSKVPQY